MKNNENRRSRQPEIEFKWSKVTMYWEQYEDLSGKLSGDLEPLFEYDRPLTSVWVDREKC